MVVIRKEKKRLIGKRSIQPDGDKINVTVDSFMMTSSTVKIDSIYAKSSVGHLGEFYDPLYGEYKSDYICQFYCKEEFTFRHKPIDGKIDSVVFSMYFASSLGDTLSPMKAEVFPVVRSLDRSPETLNVERFRRCYNLVNIAVE